MGDRQTASGAAPARIVDSRVAVGRAGTALQLVLSVVSAAPIRVIRGSLGFTLQLGKAVRAD
jgi:hypothetical protein